MLKDGINDFVLVGNYKKNDRTFSINSESKKSGSVYLFNKMNMGLFCSEKYGRIYIDLFDGYYPDRKKMVRVHGKDERGRADFNNVMFIDWEDRLNEAIVSSVCNNDLIRVAIEKDDKGKTVTKSFISAYDAIQYIADYLEDDSMLYVRGSFEWGFYKGKTTRSLKPRFIGLANESQEPKATFRQTVLLTKDSFIQVDSDKGTIEMEGYVVAYIGKYNNKEIKRKCALPFDFELVKGNASEQAYKKYFLPKKNKVNAIVFKGDIIESGTVVQGTLEDLDDDYKTLIALGLLTEEAALASCVVDGGNEKRMVCTGVAERRAENKNGIVTPILMIEKDIYDENDLDISDLLNNEEEEEDIEVKEDVENFESDDDIEDNDLLNDILAQLDIK